jgi:hypothetical protein
MAVLAAIGRRFKTSQDIDKALERGFLEEGDVESQPVTVYRGSRFTSTQAFYAAFKPDGVMYSRGYTSTSADIKVAQFYAKKQCCVLEIEVPPGTPMLGMSISSLFQKQDEVLLPPSVVFRLKDNSLQPDAGAGIVRVVAEYRGDTPVVPAKTVCRHTTVCKVAKGIVKRPHNHTRGTMPDVERDALALTAAMDALARTSSKGQYSDLVEWYALRASADAAQTAGRPAPPTPPSHRPSWSAFRKAHRLPAFRPVAWYTPAPFQEL